MLQPYVFPATLESFCGKINRQVASYGNDRDHAVKLAVDYFDEIGHAMTVDYDADAEPNTHNRVTCIDLEDCERIDRNQYRRSICDIPVEDECDHCHGYGSSLAEVEPICTVCNGSGLKQVS